MFFFRKIKKINETSGSHEISYDLFAWYFVFIMIYYTIRYSFIEFSALIERSEEGERDFM